MPDEKKAMKPATTAMALTGVVLLAGGIALWVQFIKPEKEEAVVEKEPETYVLPQRKPDPRMPGLIPDPATSRGLGGKVERTGSESGIYSIHSSTVDPVKLDFDRGPFEKREDGFVLKKDTNARAGGLNTEATTAEEDLETLGGIIGQYRRIFGYNPVAGENREVMRALTGDNTYKLVFIDKSNPAINREGELVDRWGNPVFFHAVSSTRPMEISSAGPDGEFSTTDDIVIEEIGGGSGPRDLRRP